MVRLAREKYKKIKSITVATKKLLDIILENSFFYEWQEWRDDKLWCLKVIASH